MWAARIEKPGLITVEERPDPAPGPGDVVVAVEACGVCGTDLHIADGEFEPTPYPIAVSYTHLRAHETKANPVCRLLLEKKKNKNTKTRLKDNFNQQKNHIKHSNVTQ